MPLQAPNLDDRTFEDLLREARLRIPRYCPDWTDFNDSDPGMAIVQLFAWFTEMMLYQLNRVPERNYVKFLQMLNLERQPARPARAFVCFTAVEGQGVVPVPVRSRFETAGASGDAIYFETVKPLEVCRYPLDAVQVQDGVEYLDYSTANEQGSGFRPLGWTPQPGNALYLGFKPFAAKELGGDGRKSNQNLPQFPARLVLRVFLPTASGAKPKPTLSGGPPPERPTQVLVWEYRSDLDLPTGETVDPLDRWRPLTVLADETAAFTREGNVELRGPGTDVLATQEGKPTPDDKPRYWLRCRLAAGAFARDAVPAVAFLRANAVEVESLATYTDEVLGESDGFRRQYALRHLPVNPDSLEIQVEGPGDLTESWERRDDFLASTPDDKHYTLNATSGQVLFGDGRSGRLPPPGGIVVASTYRAGGGAAGNVKAAAINSPPARVVGIELATNPRPAVGGTDEESIEALTERAPLALRGDSRAVTQDDYRRFAELVGGVAKANTVPLRHPDYPGLDVPGALTVVVVPDDTSLEAQPSQDLLALTARELDRVRTVATEVFVTGPRYRRVNVRVRVTARVEGTETQVKEGVRQAIEEYLAVVRRPEQPKVVPAGEVRPRVVSRPKPAYPLGWPFGEDFYPSRLYEVILSARDEASQDLLVRSVTSLEVLADGEKVQDRLQFGPDELPACTATVEVDPDSGEGL